MIETLKAGHLSEVEALKLIMERSFISQTEESKKLLDDLSAKHESHVSTLESLIDSQNITIGSHFETQQGHLLEIE